VRNDVPETTLTMPIPARAVGPDGSMLVRYTNVPNVEKNYQSSVTIQYDDIAVLYRVGSFEMNFLRGMVQILLAMAFLAALGVLAGSFLSFPVACLACFAVLPFCLLRQYVADAISSDVASAPVVMLFKAVTFMLPNLESMSPSENLVGGMNIDWQALGADALAALAAAAVVLLIACLLYRRRELARVQV